MTEQSYIIDKHCGTDNITVVIRGDFTAYGSATCSRIKDNIWYFNRLFVYPLHRGNSYGRILLEELLSLIKEKDAILELDINPYGQMTYEQLEKFYMNHGFIKVTQKGPLGEYPKYYYNK